MTPDIVLFIIGVVLATLLAAIMFGIRLARTPDEICPKCGDNNSLGSSGYYDCECGVVWYPRKKR